MKKLYLLVKGKGYPWSSINLIDFDFEKVQPQLIQNLKHGTVESIPSTSKENIVYPKYEGFSRFVKTTNHNGNGSKYSALYEDYYGILTIEVDKDIDPKMLYNAVKKHQIKISDLSIVDIEIQPYTYIDKYNFIKQIIYLEHLIDEIKYAVDLKAIGIKFIQDLYKCLMENEERYDGPKYDHDPTCSHSDIKEMLTKEKYKSFIALGKQFPKVLEDFDLCNTLFQCLWYGITIQLDQTDENAKYYAHYSKRKNALEKFIDDFIDYLHENWGTKEETKKEV